MTPSFAVEARNGLQYKAPLGGEQIQSYFQTSIWIHDYGVQNFFLEKFVYFPIHEPFYMRSYIILKG